MGSSPQKKDLFRGSESWPVGAAAFTLTFEKPVFVFDVLRQLKPDARSRYNTFMQLVRDFRQDCAAHRVDGVAQHDPRRKRIVNSSSASTTGSKYWAWFRVSRALDANDCTSLQQPPTAIEIQIFIDWLRECLPSPYPPFRSNLQAGSVWAYLHHVFRDIKLFYNLDLASEPALQQVLKDLDQEIAAESGTKFPILRRQVVELYKKAMRDASPCDSDFHWAAEFLLIYLAILRFCEAGYTTASQVNPTRLLSWGRSLRFFRLKKKYRWCLIPRHLQNHRETTEDVDIDDIDETPVDGIEIVWRAGVPEKGIQKGKRLRKTRRMAIWNPRLDGNLPRIADHLRTIYVHLRDQGAAQFGSPVFMQPKNGSWEPISLKAFNIRFKQLGTGIIPDADRLSSKQLRSGGKTNATWAAFEAHMADILSQTSQLGRWAPGSKVGNSDRYEDRPREYFFNIAERMLQTPETQSTSWNKSLERLAYKFEAICMRVRAAVCILQ